uniref:Coiled-coil domain-containing protein 69 n=1 Tax=Globodera pallida TaxID=36090 RepID=A0A183C4Y4_GLOPA
MDPSEEVRFLRDLIAQLENQLKQNSAEHSSGAGFRMGEQTRKRKRNGGDEDDGTNESGWFEQMEEWKRVIKLELENKLLRAELEHHKLLVAHNALQTEMMEYKRKQQQTIDELNKLKVSIDRFALKQQEHEKRMKEMNCEHQHHRKETS